MFKLLMICSRLKFLAPLFAVIIIFNLIIFPYSITHCNKSSKSGARIKSLDTGFAYSPNDVISYIKSKSQQERKCITISHLTLDTIYPVIYTLFLSSILYLITDKLKLSKKQKIAFYAFPLIIIISDYIENLLIVAILHNIKGEALNTNTLIVKILPFITTIKWSFAGITILLIALAAAILALKNITRRRISKI